MDCAPDVGEEARRRVVSHQTRRARPAQRGGVVVARDVDGSSALRPLLVWVPADVLFPARLTRQHDGADAAHVGAWMPRSRRRWHTGRVVVVLVHDETGVKTIEGNATTRQRGPPGPDAGGVRDVERLWEPGPGGGGAAMSGETTSYRVLRPAARQRCCLHSVSGWRIASRDFPPTAITATWKSSEDTVAQ